MFDWFAATLRHVPGDRDLPLARSRVLLRQVHLQGIGLGSVTATLLAGVIIGQIGITINQPLKATVFLMFLFAVGYGVGPQFVRGVAKDGLPQAIFAVVQCAFCLLVPVAIAKIAGYDLGYAAGLYSGSQTISAAMGLSTDAINRLGLPADQAKAPARHHAGRLRRDVHVRHRRLGHRDRPGRPGAAPDRPRRGLQGLREAKHGGDQGDGRRRLGLAPLGAARVPRASRAARRSGSAPSRPRRWCPTRASSSQRIRRATGRSRRRPRTPCCAKATWSRSPAPREVLVKVIGDGAKEVDDPELLNVPVEGVDVYVTSKEVDGKTLAELAKRPAARGVFLRKITRGATATSIPILPNTKIQRGDILTLVGRTQDTTAAAKMLGVPDRPTDVADVAFIGGAITIGALIGALVLKVARRAPDAVDRRRRAHRRARVRLAALDPARSSAASRPPPSGS